MSVRQFLSTTSPTTVEDAVGMSYDGYDLIIAVEIYDHPSAHYSALHDATIGPWVVGPEREVYAWLTEHGHEEYSEQASSPDPYVPEIGEYFRRFHDEAPDLRIEQVFVPGHGWLDVPERYAPVRSCFDELPFGWTSIAVRGGGALADFARHEVYG